MSELGPGPEFDLIRKMLAPATRVHPLVRVGIGDDCAIIDDIAISTDASVDEVHFRRDWLTAEEIGWRATTAAMSDLAAVAAEPVGVLISLALTSADAGEFALSLMRGAISAAESVGAVVVGGDTAHSSHLMIDAVAIGKTAAPALRSHAQLGDEVWVTGQLGGSAAAVAAWQAGKTPKPEARVRYARPLARTREARWLHERGSIHAAIDLSDGLYGDLRHITASSKCLIVVDATAIPVDTDADATFAQAVSGGEDYELAFTAPAGAVDEVDEEFTAIFGIALTKIGQVQPGYGVKERSHDGSLRDIQVGGYQHFKD